MERVFEKSKVSPTERVDAILKLYPLISAFSENNARMIAELALNAADESLMTLMDRCCASDGILTGQEQQVLVAVASRLAQATMAGNAEAQIAQLALESFITGDYKRVQRSMEERDRG